MSGVFEPISATLFQLTISKLTPASLDYGVGTTERSKNSDDDLQTIFKSMQKELWDEKPGHQHYLQSIIYVSPNVLPGKYDVQLRDVQNNTDADFAKAFRAGIRELDTTTINTWLEKVVTDGLVDVERGRNRIMVRLSSPQFTF